MTVPPVEAASANNPAGRVLDIFGQLRDLGPQMGPSSLASSLAVVLDDPVGSRTFMRRCLSLREQAFLVQDQMEPLLPGLEGAEHLFAEYSTVIRAAEHIDQCQSHVLSTFLAQISAPGWLALKYADTILSRRFGERTLDTGHIETYLDDTRSLIDQIQADDDISREDRTYLVGLLEDVERSLREIRITGTAELRKTVNAAVGGLVTAGGKSRSWYAKKSTLAVVTYLTLLLGLIDNYSEAKQIASDLSQLLSQPAITATANQAPRVAEEAEVVDAEVVDVIHGDEPNGSRSEGSGSGR